MAAGSIANLAMRGDNPVVIPVYHHRGPRYFCAYCEDIADTVDHTVPQWLVKGNLAVIKRWHFVTVSCCFDCNVRAGRKVDKTFKDRRGRIFFSLFKRTVRLRKGAYFDPEYVEDMGYNLRSMIEQSWAAGEAVRKRLKALSQRDLPPGVPNDLWLKPPPDPIE
jgi:hypothetical protein